MDAAIGAATDAAVAPKTAPVADAGNADGADAQTAATDAGSTDAGMDAAIASAPPCNGELPVMWTRDPMMLAPVEPDWSCFAPGAGPDAATAARSVKFRLAFSGVTEMPTADEETQLSLYAAGASVDFFFEPSTLGTPASSHLFDSYITQLDLPAGATRLSLAIHALPRIIPELSLVEVREYGIPINPNTTLLQGNIAFAPQRDALVNMALAGDGGQADPDKAIILAQALDCKGSNLGGAQLELIDGETNAAVPTGTAPGDVIPCYQQFALPNPMCTFSSADNAIAWVLINAPVNVLNGAKAHAYRVQVKGRMHASDREPVVFGQRDVELFAGAITSLHVLDRVTR